MRIVSFLPSATEMVCALGLSDQLVGITHECDYPDSVREKPVVVQNALDLSAMSLSEIDRSVTERLRAGASLYAVDENRLRELRPDLILTQDLCQVCAPSGNEVSRLLKVLPQRPEVLWLTPRSLSQIEDNLRTIGAATGTGHKAAQIIAQGRSRLDKIRVQTSLITRRPRVFCMEWVDPVYCSGHWVPEMVAIAGGEDRLGRLGTDSVRIEWENVVEWDPEILIVMPCGFKLEAASQQAKCLSKFPGWGELSAVRNNQLYAVNANAYFARPGPRVIDGVELLAHLIHPKLFQWRGPSDAFMQLDMRRRDASPKEKTCQACGTVFACFSKDCWCENLPPLQQVQPDTDCLCETCLQKAVAMRP